MTSSAIDYDVITRTTTEQLRHGYDMQRSSFLLSFVDSSCCVRNKIMYLLSWRTVSVLTRVLFWCLFPSLRHNWGNKHQNNPIVSAETVRHLSVYINKSPRYSGGDFVFVPIRTPPPAADTCSWDNFWTTFRISFIFGTIVGPDL